ncbi:hypothetical protein [Sphingomonas baiyangensis]|uniref:Uncharacterized protein n=1 Tax=Sphingomonas baiyangensis TaxID=2572576 RepID=A0A4U1L4B8_9SPHN|nr:hypothetical protein [Sphingomonas baiyangensis]TKD51602.1 hypothetical protein FBR43_13185 [Sphingomonas baiyangensis]
MTPLLRSVSGLILWAVAFSAIYAIQGLSCALGWDAIGLGGPSLARSILIATYIVSVTILAWLCWRLRPSSGTRDFLAILAFASSVIGLLSTIYTGLPVFWLSICS